jgi:hypothetical protein
MSISYFLMLWMQQLLWVQKLKEKSRISFNLEDLIDDDSIVTLKLSLLAFKIRREVLGV